MARRAKPLSLAEFYAQMAQRIREDPAGDGLFTTMDVLDGSSQWTDFYFLGLYKGRRVAWHAIISTVKESYLQAVQAQAWDDLYAIRPVETLPDAYWLERLPDGSAIQHSTDLPPDPLLDNMAWPDWRDKHERDLAGAGTVFVREEISIDEGNSPDQSGPFLHITLDVPAISKQTILDLIARFKKSGQVAWHGAQQYTFTVAELDWLPHSNAIRPEFVPAIVNRKSNGTTPGSGSATADPKA